MPQVGLYKGVVRIVRSPGTTEILDWDVAGIPASPQWYNALSGVLVKVALKMGQVIEIDLSVDVREAVKREDTSDWHEEDWEYLNAGRPETERYRPPEPTVYTVIHITELGTRTIVNPL